MQTGQPYPAGMDARQDASTSAAAPAASLERRLFYLLVLAALAYAFFAGLRTVSDPDLFWQLATGRWVAQHHRTFSTDVFSYTASGAPWIYPAGSALFFYAAYLLGGYVLLSWIGAAACVGTVALLLRRGSAVSAAVAILALPLIAQRTAPRAEMFTVILFAAYLSILWQNYVGSHARLWLLPLLMPAWVNLHLGFASGLALIVAFAGMDILQMLHGETRSRQAVQRLRSAAPWFLLTAACTVVNPWGWNIFSAILRQNHAMAEHSMWISEWGKAPMSWAVISRSVSLTNAQPFYLLLGIAAIAVVLALLDGRFGPAILLLCAAYEGVRHVRTEALSACVVVVVGGSVLASAVRRATPRLAGARSARVFAAAAALSVAALALFWSADAVKIHDTSLSSYGAGLSWWLPQRAVEFVQRENLPGEIFNTYIEGGYIAWALGPERRDYIDGRAIPFGAPALLHQVELLQSSPDGAMWQAEAARYNINTIILPLNRFEEELGQLKSYCNSTAWAPVYLDEVSGVFVRRSATSEDLIRRTNVNCATARFPAGSAAGSSADQFNAWANAATLLAALGRNREAQSALDKAAVVLPASSFVYWLRGNMAYNLGVLSDAEDQYRKAISRDPGLPLYWFSLAAVYKHEGRIPETIQAQRRGIDNSTTPQTAQLLKLARLYLDTQQPRAALQTFDEVVRSASPELLATTGTHDLMFEVDQGRAAAWRSLGDSKRAAEFDQKAVQDLVPGK